MQKTLILKNTTGSNITIRGRVISASNQRDFSDFDMLLLKEDETNLSALVDAGTLVVNDGDNDLPVTHGKAWIFGDRPPLVFYASSEGGSSTTNTAYQPKVTLTFDAVDGDYLIEWYAEVRCATGTRVKTKVTGGATVLHEVQTRPDGGSSGYGMVSGFYRKTLTPGSKTVDFDYASAVSGKQAGIRRARIKVMEVS